MPALIEMREISRINLSKAGPMGDQKIRKGCAGECASANKIDFIMAFQPVVDTKAKTIYAYEALVRGPNGEGAFSVLDKVTAENRYSFDQACRVKAIKTAVELGIKKKLNINFLPNAVYHPEACLKLTLATAAEYNLPHSNITFEFTENEQIMDRDHLKGIINTYRHRGFTTALDDFGAGYAGLSLLADFQTDVIKIDRILVDQVDTHKERQAVISGMLTTARLLGINVVAEGVERIEERHMLESMGIHMFQGYLFARPQIGKLATDDDINWN